MCTQISSKSQGQIKGKVQRAGRRDALTTVREASLPFGRVRQNINADVVKRCELIIFFELIVQRCMRASRPVVQAQSPSLRGWAVIEVFRKMIIFGLMTAE